MYVVKSLKIQNPNVTNKNDTKSHIMSATAAHSSRRSSRHKAKEESVKEEESNDLTEISNVQLVREAIEEDQDDINSPLRSMRNLEDVTMTFNTNNVIKETDNAKKTRMKTPKTRSTKKKTKKQEESVRGASVFSADKIGK